MAEEEEDLSSLPLTERFVHKNWKVRKEAYEAAAKEFDGAQSEADATVRQFVLDSSLLKGAVLDSNVAAHQEGLTALCSFLQIAGTQGCNRTYKYTIVPLVEKGLTSVKAGTKQKAMDAILLYVEMDKPEPIVEELLPLLKHKLPKVIAAALSAFTAIYHAYGCKVVPPKPVLTLLPGVFGHGDKNVRAEGQALTVELYRWLKDAMKPHFWSELKPVQQQDIEKLFEKVKDEPPPKPERLLKSQQSAVDNLPGDDIAGDTAPGEEDEESVVDDLEPEHMTINVFQKIPHDLHDRLASSKWKDRKEALDELYIAVNVPAIQEGQFDDIMRVLAKLMKDANIAVVTVAANCVESLAKGLRRSFSKYRSIVVSPIMERLKERKQSVTDALAAALDAIFVATSLSECLEETVEAMKGKNPLVKLEATRFLLRCLKFTKQVPSISEVKLICDSTKPLLGDSQEAQRTVSHEVLGTLSKIMGDRVMGPNLDSLDDARKAKIREIMSTAEVKAKFKPDSVAPPPKQAATAIQKKPVTKKPAGTTQPKKVAAPAPASPPAASTPAPLQPRLTARPGIAKPGMSRGLKPPTTGSLVQKPSGPRTAQSQATAASSLASPGPRRPVHSPPKLNDEPIPAHKISRGLTGRPLSKPFSVTPVESVTVPSTPTQSRSLPSMEQTELDELRAHVERLRATNEHLRSEALRMSSQVNELQNQNAQLIEDHTRDVLSIKAKETQLVRARSDAQTAEQTSTQLQREVDRLKRELGRVGRAASPRAPDYRSADLLPDSHAVNGATGPGGAVPSRNAPTTSSTSSVNASNGDGNTHQQARSPRPTSMFVGLGAGVRNPPLESSKYHQPTPYSILPQTNGSGRLTDSDARSSGTSTSSTAPGLDVDGSGRGAAGMNGHSQGQESWRRAAEVTQNLKARIELMKAKKQGLGR